MFRNSLKPYRLLMLPAFFLLVFNSFVYAENPVKALDKEAFGVAIKGYDSVAYFTEGQAVKGSDKYALSWNEAVWYFSSAEHRELFAANPKKYAPNRGGW